ncbi:MAG: Ldh family oxidoreductase [Erysipelotrichaceae bacterium]|nr:Ldh family oxidoreductase [Erysipelotrichaceae bacterium]
MSVVKTMEEVREYVRTVLKNRNVTEEAANIVADSLAYADGRGTRSHGINMLNAYIDRIKGGGVDVNASPVIERESASYVVADARNTFGQYGVQFLTDTLLKKVKDSPVVCGSIRNLNHCGALAYYTEQCARKGYVAFLFVNANPTVAPFGAMEAKIGTNPMSVALPKEGDPIVLDMASSAVAKAKIYHAAKTGHKIDPSWALDQNGNPTDDPNEAIKGVLTAMAGPKGYGIALVVETMAGVISGAGITDEVSSVHRGIEKGMNAGAFMILIDPKAFLSEEEYTARMNKLVCDIRNSKPQPGKKIFLPGEIEQQQLKKAETEGIEYDEVFFE